MPFRGDEAGIDPVGVVGGDAIAGVGHHQPQFLVARFQLDIEAPGADRGRGDHRGLRQEGGLLAHLLHIAVHLEDHARPLIAAHRIIQPDHGHEPPGVGGDGAPHGRDILKGLVSLKDLAISKNTTIISKIMEVDIHRASVDDDAEEVAQTMQKYDLVAIPVVDAIGRLVGRITIDDVVDVIREEAERDYQLASGLTEDVEYSDTIYRNARARLPWLVIGLTGGVFGAIILGRFESDLRIYPEMAFFIPLIAAMGGNVGIQSSAIVVQGLANNTLRLDRFFSKLSKDFAVAFINALILSGLIFAYNFFISDSFALTITVSAALMAVIVFASMFGTVIPILLNKFGADPALATGPFITTSNDIFGLLIYMLVGRILYGVFA